MAYGGAPINQQVPFYPLSLLRISEGKQIHVQVIYLGTLHVMLDE